VAVTKGNRIYDDIAARTHFVKEPGPQPACLIDMVLPPCCLSYSNL